MVKRDAIRNLSPGNKLLISCDSAAELNSAYQTAYQMRQEVGLSKDELSISKLATEMVVVTEYQKGGVK